MDLFPKANLLCNLMVIQKIGKMQVFIIGKLSQHQKRGVHKNLICLLGAVEYEKLILGAPHSLVVTVIYKFRNLCNMQIEVNA